MPASFTIVAPAQSRGGAPALPALTVPGSFVGSSGYFLFVFGAGLTGFSDSRQGAYTLVFDAVVFRCYAVYAASPYQAGDTFQASGDTLEWNMFVCTGFKAGETTLAGILDRVATDAGSLAASSSEPFSANPGNTRWTNERVITAVAATSTGGGTVSVSGGTPSLTLSPNDGTTYGEHAVDDNYTTGGSPTNITYTDSVNAGAGPPSSYEWGVGVFSIIGSDSAPLTGTGPGGADEDAGKLDFDFGPDGRLLLAYVDAAGALQVERYDDAFPPAVAETVEVVASGVLTCAIQCHRDGIWNLLYSTGAAVLLRTSRDQGATWSVATTVISGSYSTNDGWLDEETGLWVVPVYLESASRWDYVVGTCDGSGVWSFGSARTLIGSAKGSGRLQRDRAGIWTFAYSTTGGAQSIVRCRDLSTTAGTFS